MMTVRFPFGKKTVEFPYDPNELADRLQRYVDQKGVVRNMHNNPTRGYLNMIFEEGELAIEIMIDTQVRGNGSHRVRVSYREKEVMQLSGNYAGKPFGTKVELYAPGDWEKEIPQ